MQIQDPRCALCPEIASNIFTIFLILLPIKIPHPQPVILKLRLRPLAIV